MKSAVQISDISSRKLLFLSRLLFSGSSFHIHMWQLAIPRSSYVHHFHSNQSSQMNRHKAIKNDDLCLFEILTHHLKPPITDQASPRSNSLKCSPSGGEL